MEFKEIMHKTWNFIWHSNSVWSWIVNIILAFVIIKFLLYPGLGLALGTSHPIVAVVSNSMEHDYKFDRWWDSNALCNGKQCTQGDFYRQFNITKEQFLEFSFKNGFDKGDIMFLKGIEPAKINIGDVIVFKSGRPDPIIHRVIKIQEINGRYYFQTKGDHNYNSIDSPNFNEMQISEEQIIGKAMFRVPYLGWVKIGFVELVSLFIR